MGINRDGRYHEAGIVERIPEEGLPVLWRAEVSSGYSGPAVAAGRVFITDYVATSGESTNNPGGRDRRNGSERVLCFDATTGAELWKVAYDRPYNLSYANGPRATPTVDGDRVYTLGAEGDLYCLKTATGDIVWNKQLAEESKSETPIWGHAAHPLVHGDLLYCLVGGDKMTGEIRWSALSASEIGYCPPTIQTIGGKPQLIIWHADSLNGLDPSSGAVYWSYPLQPRYGMSIAAPQLSGDLLFASGIGETAVMLQMQADGTPGKALWTGKPKLGIYCGNATALIDGDTIYGSDCGLGAYLAANVADGQYRWQTFQFTTGGDRRASHGTAFTIKHSDKFILFAETGDLIFARFSPQDFQELGRMRVLEPTSVGPQRDVVWSHPALANRCFFARNDQELVCVSLAAQ
jgi:outer membrane protein assembly factor BamB